MSIGEKIRKRRGELGLSLRDLAAAVGVSHVFIGRVERDLTALPRDRYSAVAEALRIDVKNLELWATESQPLMLDVSGWPEAPRAAVVEFARAVASSTTPNQEVSDFLARWSNGCE